MVRDLDRTDIEIVAELSEDGRRSFREIARKLAVSEGTVRTRVARMQEQGLINICAVGSPTALGIACNALVMIKVKPGGVNSAAERLAEFPHVRYVGVTMGSSDISIQTFHNSFEELFEFVSETIPKLVPDVIGTETFQIARVLKSQWDWADWLREGLIPAPTQSTGADLANDRAASLAKSL